MTQAQSELHRIAPLTAFNVSGATKRRKVNQHLARYDFPDGSRLEINARAMKGKAFDASGLRVDTLNVKTNTIGNMKS